MFLERIGLNLPSLERNLTFYLVFKLFSEPNFKKMTWYDARDYCKTIGGDLISIHSAEEQRRFPNRYAKPNWEQNILSDIISRWHVHNPQKSTSCKMSMTAE